MVTFTSAEDFHTWRFSIEQEPVAVIMTMGALHDGHVALISAAQEHRRTQWSGKGQIVVTIFVNPTQFNDDQDFEKYPRTFAQDVGLCEERGIDAVLVPTVADVYPEGLENVPLIAPSKHAEVLDGPHRPGHFSGVVTVVSRLCDMVQPNAAFFGEKDFQQLVVVRDLMTTQKRNVEIIGVPTVRQADGVALSSRNSRLSITGRALAKHIPATFSLVKHLLDQGHHFEDCVAQGAQYLAMQPGIELEYLEIRDNNLDLVDHAGPARIFVALNIGNVRLIDNELLEIGEENVARN